MTPCIQSTILLTIGLATHTVAIWSLMSSYVRLRDRINYLEILLKTMRTDQEKKMFAQLKTAEND